MIVSTLSLLSVTHLALVAGYLHLDIERRVASPYSHLSRRQSFDVALSQSADKLEYLINITVGTPPQSMAVTLDTGSSDLWVPATSSQPCQKGKCDAGAFDPEKSETYSIIDQGGFNITYAAAGDSDAGDWVEETITVGGSTSINSAIIGVSLDGYDAHGVMGIGFDTNEAEPNPSQNGSYPSVVDNMVSQGLIDRKAYSLYLNDLNQSTGSICFGCVDSTKYTGELVALPLQKSSPVDETHPGTVREFMVTLTSVVFTDAAGLATTLTADDYAQSVLLDSGTSATLLSNDVFEPLALGMGAVGVEQGIYVVPCSYSSTNATLTYTFGGQDGPSVTVPFAEIIGNQDFTSKHFNAASGGCDLGIGPPNDGSVILGDTFLRNAYVVFDIDNKQAAIAQAAGGQAGTSSIQAISSGTGIPGVTSTATASGTQLSGAEITASPNVPAASTSGEKVLSGTPTFNLGPSATNSDAHAVGTTNNLAPTRGPQVVLLGAGLMAGAILF